MTFKKGIKIKKKVFKNIKFLDPKKINLVKLKINPANIVESTKTKIGSYYINLKKEWEKNKERKEIKKKLDEKKRIRKSKKI